MADWLRWRLSLRRNANFWDWVRDTYSAEDLRRLVAESTDCDLIREWSPLADRSHEPGNRDDLIMDRTVARLIARYSDDIWTACLGAGGYDTERGPTGVACLARLDLAYQVYNRRTFEEFLVRNALKRAAAQILAERNSEQA